MPYTPETADDQRIMLERIGVRQFEELLAGIPETIPRASLSIPEGLSEPELLRHCRALAARNWTVETHRSFLGAGAYEHWIPSVVRYLTSRGEFLTAYTPYQAEASQGTLQAMYEFQSLICELTGMDVANASLYDGATSMAEAALLALRQTERSRLIVASTIHPEYRQVLRTYLRGTRVEIFELPEAGGVTDLKAAESAVDRQTAALLVQMPNFTGCLEPVDPLGTLARQVGALTIVMVNPITLGVLKPPGSYGADLVVGEGQPLGIPLAYGGPYLGFFACRQAYVRRVPGRIVGMTKDARGRRGFTLTLQTREQHIRRARATSNICTNEGMCAFAATIALCALGKQGLREVAEQNVAKAHYAHDQLTTVRGITPMFTAPFFNEFALHLPCDAADLNARLLERGFLGGVDLGRFDNALRRGWLVCVTETKTREDIDAFVAAVREELPKVGQGQR